jgi:hypothetical protein
MTDAPGSVGERVVLHADLEELGDPWPVLRQQWQRLGSGDILVVRYGKTKPRFRTRAVAHLLRLAGFRPVGNRSMPGGREMEAAWAPRLEQAFSCSVIVPCRNEIGNVDSVVRRLPPLGTHTELIFVDGASTDGTPQRIETIIDENPHRDIKLLHQRGRGGKAEAVFMGFDAAQCDVLMILDADMTVAPEDLPRFFAALAEGVGDFANGTRFVYPMESGAMRLSNNLGNRVFTFWLSWLLRTRISDTLCGTKAFFQRDWSAISAARSHFGGHDRWGDFDLLLGAGATGLRVVDVPVVYGARTAGDSKMHPFHDGLALARTCLAGVGWRRIAQQNTAGRTD